MLAALTIPIASAATASVIPAARSLSSMRRERPRSNRLASRNTPSCTTSATPLHTAMSDRDAVRDGARQRQGEAEHGAAQAYRGGGIAGLDQRRLAVRRDRNVEGDEDC